MAILLSIDTSTVASSVALHENGVLLACQEIHLLKSHSEYLVPSIKHLYEVCGVDLATTAAVAVAKGPGSYTGLRIGTATAKGLCYGLDARLIAVNTLEAMAYGVSRFYGDGILLCPMIDARRMEVYCLVADSGLNIIEPTRAVVVDENSFSNLLAVQKIVFFGNGAHKCKPALMAHNNAVFVDDIHPSARYIGELAWRAYQEQKFEDLSTFEPFYLKDFIAKKPSASKLV